MIRSSGADCQQNLLPWVGSLAGPRSFPAARRRRQPPPLQILQSRPRFLNLRRQFLLVRQDGAILGGQHLVGENVRDSVAYFSAASRLAEIRDAVACIAAARYAT
jgi:hypothetical protein